MKFFYFNNKVFCKVLVISCMTILNILGTIKIDFNCSKNKKGFFLQKGYFKK